MRHVPDPEIAPDEIFLDAKNEPRFDRARFEGRLEKPLARSSFALLGILGAFLAFALALQAWNLEVREGSRYTVESEKNSLTPEPLFALRGVITDRNGVVLADNEEGPDGVVRRAYPIGAFGQVLGYVSYPKKDANGRYYDSAERGMDGVEAAYDAELSGENGELLVETDALGAVRSSGTIVPPKDGAPLRTSLDADLERALARAIAGVVDRDGFVGGAGVIMDVSTGEILALVSYPSYDSNVLSNGGPAPLIMSYTKSPRQPFLDRAVGGLYAPGSTVKPLVAAGALTDGVITPTTIVDDPGFIAVKNPYNPAQTFIYKDWRALGAVDVRRAIAWSSDVYFYTVGGGFGNQKGLGIERLAYWYRHFGLGTATGLPLPGENAGRVPDPAWKESAYGEPWYLGDTYHTAIGQYALQVTPLQMARAIAAVANGGTLPTPTVRAGDASIGAPLSLDPAALAVVRDGMRRGVTEALATALDLPGVSVAAKTGTAQVGLRNEFDNAWVEGFFPFAHPRYAFAVVLERGPSGLGEEAVAAMRAFFDELVAARSPYLAPAISLR